MFLEFINTDDLKKFAESEFGKITTLKKFKHKKNDEIFYNMTFRLKENGAYEEAFFYDFNVYPIRVEGMEDRTCEKINERFNTFMTEHLSGDIRNAYEAIMQSRKVDKELKKIL